MLKTLFRFTRASLPALFCTLAAGCATTAGPNKDLPATAQYREALAQIEEKRLTHAGSALKSMQVQFPFNEYTHRLQLDLAQAYVDAGELEMATVMVNQFIAMYPRHPYVDRAFYLRGITNYARGIDALDMEQRRDPYQARTDLARTSYKDLSLMIQRFPDSAYANDARDKLINLREHLAGHEIRLALLSLQEGDTTSARRRATYVIDNYPNTAAHNDANNILIQTDEVARPAKGQGMFFMSDNESPVIDLTRGGNAPSEPVDPMVDAAPVQPKQNLAVQREAWIMQQPPSRYTIQVTTTNRPRWLEQFLGWLNDFLNENEMRDDVAYYQRTIQGEQTYAVLYGSYDSLRSAQSAKAQLIQSLGIEDLWVRRYQEIQSAINTSTRLN